MIHAGLKGSWCIDKAKRHNKELIVSKMASEGCLVHSLLPCPDLMVSKAQINFGEVYCPMQFIQYFIYSGNEVSVLDGSLIQCSVIYAHAHSSILLFDQHN
jgi:hypothetical protein